MTADRGRFQEGRFPVDEPLVLPSHPNLNWLKNRAKEKLQQLRALQPTARLAQAQLAIARAYGFPSWRELKQRVERLAAEAASGPATPPRSEDLIDPVDHPQVLAAVVAIQRGDIEALKKLLAENPALATIRLGRATSTNPREMSLLHVATDWPGHYPNGAETVSVLVAAGADVNARFEGRHSETPLHWAASSDDLAVLDALLDHGADIEASGAVIGGGTPLADAAAFGQWRAAHRLVERGANTSLWQAAALGYLDRVQGHLSGAPLQPWFASGPRPNDPPDEVTHAFWCACHGGQQEVAELLLDRGADINWSGYDNLTPLGAARRAGADALVAWLINRGAR
jgi:ankyrin repeat protein